MVGTLYHSIEFIIYNIIKPYHTGVLVLNSEKVKGEKVKRFLKLIKAVCRNEKMGCFFIPR